MSQVWPPDASKKVPAGLAPSALSLIGVALTIQLEWLKLSFDTACWMGLSIRRFQRASGSGLDLAWLGFGKALTHFGRLLGSFRFDWVADLNPIWAKGLV